MQSRLLFIFKIGTYDKDNWEITVERQEVNQVLSGQLSVVKLPTDLLDIDLIRGKYGHMKRSFFILKNLRQKLALVCILFGIAVCSLCNYI